MLLYSHFVTATGNQLEASVIKQKFIDLVNTHFLERLPSYQERAADNESEAEPLLAPPRLALSDADRYRIPDIMKTGGRYLNH